MSTAGTAAAVRTSREYRIERTVVFERELGARQAERAAGEGADASPPSLPAGAPAGGGGGPEGVLLRGVHALRHSLSQCTILERSSRGGEESETRRRYRLHRYVVRKHASSASAALAATTTTISLAFPVGEDLTPLRSAEGELVFAYLPVISAGFGFAIDADFELVASRQDLSHSHSGAPTPSQERAGAPRPAP